MDLLSLTPKLRLSLIARSTPALCSYASHLYNALHARLFHESTDSTASSSLDVDIDHLDLFLHSSEESVTCFIHRIHQQLFQHPRWTQQALSSSSSSSSSPSSSSADRSQVEYEEGEKGEEDKVEDDSPKYKGDEDLQNGAEIESEKRKDCICDGEEEEKENEENAKEEEEASSCEESPFPSSVFCASSSLSCCSLVLNEAEVEDEKGARSKEEEEEGEGNCPIHHHSLQTPSSCSGEDYETSCPLARFSTRRNALTVGSIRPLPTSPGHFLSSSCCLPTSSDMKLFEPLQNVLLTFYDGHGEDLLFAYYQMISHVTVKLKKALQASLAELKNKLLLTEEQTARFIAKWMPQTVLVLYQSWHILSRCEGDEETEERIKKLLNLCELVVVSDEEVCAAYQQLCPHVRVIAHAHLADDESAHKQKYPTTKQAPNLELEMKKQRKHDEEVIFSGWNDHVDACDRNPFPTFHLVPLQTPSSSPSVADSLSASCVSTISQAHTSPPVSPSTFIYSSMPLAPQSSPNASPPHPSSRALTADLASCSDFDIHALIAKKRERIGMLSSISSSIFAVPHPRSFTSCPIFPTPRPVVKSNVVVIGSLPLEEDHVDHLSINQSDCLELFAATRKLALSSNCTTQFVFLLFGMLTPHSLSISTSSTSAPNSSGDDDFSACFPSFHEPNCISLHAHKIQAEFGRSFHDVESYKDWLYVQSQQGSKLLTIHGMLTNESVWNMHASLLDVELKLCRVLDDQGWCSKRIHRSVPVYLDFCSTLGVQRQGVQGVFIRRLERAACSEHEQLSGCFHGAHEDETFKVWTEQSDEDEQEAGRDHVDTAREESDSDEEMDHSLFVFPCSRHMNLLAQYNYLTAAQDLLPLIDNEQLRMQMCEHNQQLHERHNMKAVAQQYLTLVDGLRYYYVYPKLGKKIMNA